MESVTLHIKNMVCSRCIMVVREELQHLGAKVLHIELGYAEISSTSSPTIRQIEEGLRKFGFELIRDKEKVLVEEIKVKIIELQAYAFYKVQRVHLNIKISYIKNKISYHLNCIDRACNEH